MRSRGRSMIRFIKSAALALALSATSTFAQSPVLTNGGFEQSPPNNYGNNVGHSIAPWVLTSGSTNVVTVDGPGGLTWYGSSGPASDASGGSGNLQHYFDQANISGTIYQEFTPLCSGDVTYGMFFSTRDNASGSASVSIYSADGSTQIAGPAAVSIAAGNSELDPWQIASFIATLTANTTYRFTVNMGDNLNMDNAYVAFGPECTEHSSPDWSGPDDTPEPVPAQCTPFSQGEVLCNAQTGEIVVQIDNALAGTFDPNTLDVECLTPGVSVSQNPVNPFELIVTGASPGQTVTIATNAVHEGAGDGVGLDLCCIGEMEIIIPEEMVCEAPVDVSIEKSWLDNIDHDDSGAAGQLPPHGFEINVDLETGSLNPGDVITVDDPASGQINVTAFGTPYAPAGWTCSITAGSWSCQYVVPLSGAVLPATIIYPSIIDGASHVKNCASVSVENVAGTSLDVNPVNNSSCWEINEPAPEETGLSITKACSPMPVDGETSIPCQIIVTGSAPAGHQIIIGDAYTNSNLNGGTNGQIGQLTGPSAWNCATAPYSGSNLPLCSISGADFATMGGSATFMTSVTVSPENMGGEVWNCANVGFPNEQLAESCVDINANNPVVCTPSPETAGDQIDNDCDRDIDEAEGPTPEFSVFKSCGPLAPTAIVGELSMACTVSVTPLTPFGGILTIEDVPTTLTGGGSAPSNGNVTFDPNVWSCGPSGGTTTCTTPGSSYPVDGDGVPLTTTINMTVAVQGTSGAVSVQNCAGGDFTFDTGTQSDVSDYCVTQTYDANACVPEPEIVDGIDNDCDGEIDEGFSAQGIAPVAPDLTIGKSSTGACTVNMAAQTYRCGFELTVENSGSSPFNGPLALDDSFGDPNPRAVRNVQGDGWECTDGAGAGTGCLNIDLDLAPGASSALGMSLTIPGLAAGGSFENCVKQGVSDDPDQRARTAQSALNAMGIDVGKVDGKIGKNTRRGIALAQERLGLAQTGELSDALFAAMGLSGPEGAAPVCVKVDLPPMPQPPLTCQPSTTRKIDGACVCLYKNMYQKNKSSCGCTRGRTFVAGKGCVRKQVATPSKPRPNKPAPRKCEQGFELANGKCVLIKQGQCKPGYRAVGNACMLERGGKDRKAIGEGQGGSGI